MFNYNIDYYGMLCKAVENLNLPDERYRIYYSATPPMLIKAQTKDRLYATFQIKNNKLSYLTFPQEIERGSNVQAISKFILEADKNKQIIIEKVDNSKSYYYFDTDMKLKRKEDKNDELDKFNKENHNYFNCEKYSYEKLNQKMKEHIKNSRLELLSNFKA